MSAISVDIGTMLVSANIGLTLATNLFIARMPTTPNNVTTIYDMDGRPSMLSNDNGNYDYAGIQIIIRHKEYPEVMALAETIKDTLHGRANMPLNGYLYALISHSSGPALLDWDANNRARVVINFNIQRRKL